MESKLIKLWKRYNENKSRVKFLEKRGKTILFSIEKEVSDILQVDQALMSRYLKCATSPTGYCFVNPGAKNPWLCLYCQIDLYHRHNGHDGEKTKSQAKSLAQIKRYFEDCSLSPLRKFEETFQTETGWIYISVETNGNIYTREGGHFCIGRRGGVRVLSTYTLNPKDDPKFYARHYAKMLGGKVGWDG